MPRHNFLYALLASISLHALVLFGQAPRAHVALPGDEVPPPLTTRLVESVAEAEPKKEEMPRQPAPRRPVNAPQSQAVEPTHAAPRPQVSVLPAPTAAPPAAMTGALPSSAQGATRAQAMEVPLAQSIARYKQQVLGVAAGFNQYPPLARQNNWEGAVEVLMRVRDGGLRALSVKASSGHRVLDERAVEMFRQAQSRVPLPEALRDKDFMMELKAVFRLKDEG
jgi:periplasmic protein TonB